MAARLLAFLVVAALVSAPGEPPKPAKARAAARKPSASKRVSAVKGPVATKSKVLPPATSAPEVSDQPPPPPNWGRPEQEQFLKTAQIIKTTPLAVGITKSLRVTMSDGNVRHDAHVQFVDMYKDEYKTKLGVEKNFKDTYKFNIAAYLVDKMIGLNMVPATVERVIDGKPASVTWWADGVQFTEEQRLKIKKEPPDPQRWTDQFTNMRMFDQLIANTDRNQGNLVITNDWKLVLIDHTRAFRVSEGLPEPKFVTRINLHVLENLRKLDPAEAQRTLSPYLSSEEIRTLLTRRDALVQFFDSEIANKGRDAVLTGLPRKTPVATVP